MLIALNDEVDSAEFNVDSSMLILIYQNAVKQLYQYTKFY